MKILVTGSRGMLGSDIVSVLSEEQEVIGVNSRDFDIAEKEVTIQFIKKYKPNLIIHSAAYTDVDGCESNIEKAFSINALGTRNVAIAAQEINAAMLYVSTDYVYDGLKRAPYFEYDSTNPLSIYGKSKMEGENFLKSFVDKFYIVRTSWLFGLNGKNFVRTMLELSKTKYSLNIVDDQIGSPTYTLDLAKAIKVLVESECYGTYHITNSEYCSWYDFTKHIYETANIKHVKLNPITTEELGRPAPRPKNSKLEMFYWKLNGFNELRSYKDAVDEYIKKIIL